MAVAEHIATPHLSLAMKRQFLNFFWFTLLTPHCNVMFIRASLIVIRHYHVQQRRPYNLPNRIHQFKDMNMAAQFQASYWPGSHHTPRYRQRKLMSQIGSPTETSNTTAIPVNSAEPVDTAIPPTKSAVTNDATKASSDSSQGKSSHLRKRPIIYPPPPSPSEFPDWAFQPRDYFRFEILHQSSKSLARVGRIHTPHGVVDTPGFVAVATNAALKGVDFRDADNAGQQLTFANTYHLLLHPGADIIEAAGGIHQWTNRKDRPFITDSGGFQVFSLAYGSVHEELTSKGELKRKNAPVKEGYRTNVAGNDAVKVTEEGAFFRSYRDGAKFLLTPETTVQAQKKIGADIIIPLDELPGYYVDRDLLVESVDRTHRWEARSLQEHLKDVKNQAMYCVIHGGVDVELRTKSMEYLTTLPFDGFGIGGSLGSNKEELKDLLSWLMPLMDQDKERKRKPRHLLGIADEESIRNAVSQGIDTLDSCYPTRLGRHGTLLSREGHVRIKSGTHARSFGVKVDDQCTCKTCQHYDRAYLWHLFKANEPVAIALATLHNIHYMNDLMADIRQQITDDMI